MSYALSIIAPISGAIQIILKTLTYLGFNFVNSLPWLTIDTHGSKLSISFLFFYRNIVCKKYLECIGPSCDILFSKITVPLRLNGILI